jgi:PleD family two-component response regulator
MLTAKGETPQKIKGFELGADDYLVKPYPDRTETLPAGSADPESDPGM